MVSHNNDSQGQVNENTEESIKEAFEKELGSITPGTVLSAQYRRKKLVAWCTRTVLVMVLYILFWNYEWVRWTLIGYVPLNLFGLWSIYGWNAMMQKKIARTREKAEEADRLSNEIEE
ncbi:MAG: hypothetical protein MJA30_14895 [Cytophagales bacterium]|nr:hypothetical protein [Cytophagales bacterium]